jgi:non-canonical purine NTP pyrophosphatase (RdgB/HAM1 family)
MRDLLIATTNKGKLAEFTELFGHDRFRVRAAAEVLVPMPVVIEDGTTFAENARKKAHSIARESLCLTLADDSGLEVDALSGAPGVYSARFAGEGATDAQNREHLVARLLALQTEAVRFPARFRCALCLIDPLAEGGATMLEVDGVCEGSVILEERGTSGFGYDVLFMPEGYNKTFGELPSDVKHTMSHRGHAMTALLAGLGSSR